MNKSIFDLPEGPGEAGGARAHSDYPDYSND